MPPDPPRLVLGRALVWVSGAGGGVWRRAWSPSVAVDPTGTVSV